MKRIVIALTVVLAHLCVLAGANVKSARIGSLRASQTVVTNVTGAVSQSDVDAAISASNLIGRADARRDFVGTNKANSVGSGFSIVDAGGSSVLGIGKDETDSDVWRGGLYAKGVIDDYGTKKYGVKLEKNEYSPRRGRVCVRDLDHFYYDPIASVNDATNAAYQVVTNAVGDGYLCTVEAAEAMVDGAKGYADNKFVEKDGGSFIVPGGLAKFGGSYSGLFLYGYDYNRIPSLMFSCDFEQPAFIISVSFDEGFEFSNESVMSCLYPDGTPVATSNMVNEIATNAAEAVVGDVLQYALTNITDNTERFELESGTIGNLYLDGDHTNIWLTLQYPARNDRASDTLLRVVCVSNTTLAISSAYTDVDGSGWQNVPKGTNTIAATRVAFKDGRSIVNVAVKSW